MVRRAFAVLVAFTLAGCYSQYTFLEFMDGSPQSLSLTPQAPTVTTLATTLFCADGGISPYHYSVISGPGDIDEDSGEFSSLLAGTSTIRVVDVYGRYTETTVDVVATGDTGMWISPASIIIGKNEQVDFTAGGGDGPYTYSILEGDGLVDGNSGIFVSPDGALNLGFAVIQVEDKSAATALAIVQISDPDESFFVSPESAVMCFGESIEFVAVGAVAPVNWAAKGAESDPAMAGGLTSTYTPNGTGMAMVIATDGAANEVVRPVLIINP